MFSAQTEVHRLTSEVALFSGAFYRKDAEAPLIVAREREAPAYLRFADDERRREYAAALNLDAVFAGE